MRSDLLITVLLACLSFCPAWRNLLAAEAGTAVEPKRILLIGNSYTSQSRGALQKMLAASPYKDSTLSFITKGGATLQRHLADPATREKIQQGNWDVVLLQEQSQTPAFPGKPSASFHQSVDEFSKLIREAGAEPVLFMTWGRRDGDARNKAFLPDYETMQRKLTEAYRSAAKRNQIQVAAVGDAWAWVRREDDTLGKALYKKDGSHPSGKGAALVSTVILFSVFEGGEEAFQAPSGLSEQEWALMKEAAVKSSVEPQRSPR